MKPNNVNVKLSFLEETGSIQPVFCKGIQETRKWLCVFQEFTLFRLTSLYKIGALRKPHVLIERNERSNLRLFPSKRK